MKKRRAERRMITVFDETGAPQGCVTARPGEEAKRLREGWSWKEGELGGRLNPATGRINKLRPVPFELVPNGLTGIPQGAKVIVHGELVKAGDPGFDGTTLRIDVDHDEDVRVTIAHPLHEFTRVTLDCTPSANSGGHKVGQPFGRMRIAGYERVASGADQRDALIKVVAGLLALLTEEQLVTIDPDGRAVLAGMLAVKARVPKPEPSQ